MNEVTRILSNLAQGEAHVHEAYLRLVEPDDDACWDNRGHFSAAAEAMRRLLVEAGRRKQREKHGGDRTRIDLDAAEPAAPDSSPRALSPSTLPSLGCQPRIRKQRSRSNSATSPGFPPRGLRDDRT